MPNQHVERTCIEKFKNSPTSIGSSDFSYLVPSFLSFADVSALTVRAYTSSLVKFFGYLRERNIEKATRQDILDYRDNLRRYYKASTVQRHIVGIRLFFRWTLQEGYYPNIADNIKGVKISSEHKKDYLTSGQVKRLLSSIDVSTLSGLRNYAIIVLMITGGLRTIEIARANINDMRSRGDDTVLYVHGKGRDDKNEYVKIPDQVEIAIRKYLKAQNENKKACAQEYFKQGNLRENIHGEVRERYINNVGDICYKVKQIPLFRGLSNNKSQDGRLSTRAISGMVKSHMLATGLDSDRLTAHSLRHTAVTLSLLGGNSLEEAQQFARHGKISTTQIYAHHIDRATNQCENTIANAIF